MKHICVFAGLLSLVVTGCTAEWIIPKDYYVACESDADCPDTASCMLTDDGRSRVCVTDGRAECGNGVQEAGEACDDGEANTTIYGPAGRCNLACDDFAPHCGDGFEDSAETCDEGENNTDAYDTANSCNLSCTGLAPHCGDGVVNGGESCDSGSLNSDVYGVNGRCNSTCSGFAPSCGDGVTNGLEVCDDGENNTSVYGTEITCNLSCNGYALYCGDGVISEEYAEACDNPDPNSGCTAICQKGPDVECGDLVTHSAFEQCDDGVGESGLPETESCTYGASTCLICDENCQVRQEPGPRCGDGDIQNGGVSEGTYEGCDGDVPCETLGLGTGTALCGDECMAYDTSACSDQSMVYVPAGPFYMGCNQTVDFECQDGESPPHEVLLDAFLIDRTEVTAEAYYFCVLDGDCEYNGGSGQYYTYLSGMPNHPINFVSWDDALTFCRAQDKRLPTEAEWEKAARGTDGRKYPWGNSPEVSCSHAVMSQGGFSGYGCGNSGTAAVGTKPLGVSPYGALDMVGGIWEWVSDRYYGDYYSETPEGGWVNPTGPEGAGELRVLRGGCYQNFTTYSLRVSRREFYYHYTRDGMFGFRCAKPAG